MGSHCSDRASDGVDESDAAEILASQECAKTKRIWNEMRQGTPGDEKGADPTEDGGAFGFPSVREEEPKDWPAISGAVQKSAASDDAGERG